MRLCPGRRRSAASTVRCSATGKSAKSLARIELLRSRPETFWSRLEPREYGFYANVDPATPHPRWSQARERLIDTGSEVPTLVYNGYGEEVAGLYKDMDLSQRGLWF